MTESQNPQNITVAIDRIFLDVENPRHKPFENQGEVIAYLCKYEDVYPLAKDIVNIGLNPLERFALIPVELTESGAESTYTVAEGNRRMCALKLLYDPELAPADLRSNFKKLNEENTYDFSLVPATIFEERALAKIWLERIHSGTQGGAGRKEWNAEQKTRFTGDTKNATAQALLDYAEAKNIISSEDRNGKLTTVQRYLSNSLVKDALGIANGVEAFTRTRPESDFDLALTKFVNDLIVGKKVSSRLNKVHIEDYARELSSTTGLSNTRIDPEPIVQDKPKDPGNKRKARPPRKPQKPKHINYEKAIYTGLQTLGGAKLPSLYYSICDIPFENHTPLLSVGVWSFFESLTAHMGRDEKTDFVSFFSKQKVSYYGLGDTFKAITDSLKRIQSAGNTTKHHNISANFNGEQLANDMDTLKGLILKCIEQATTTTT
jgi:hypothetical protein